MSENRSPLRRADDLLESLATTISIIENITAEYNAALAELSSRHEARLADWREELAADEKELMTLMKRSRATIFDGRDKVMLKNGVLLYGREPKVKIPRDALEKAELLGLDEAIKVSKSIDRGVVETWPDERLLLIGAERHSKEVYSYEISTAAKAGSVRVA